MGCCGSRYEHDPELNKLSFSIANDYKEIEGRFTGDGIKKTTAWQATITGEDLRRKREEFWHVQRSGQRHVWLYIRQACEADAETAKTILEMAEIKLERENMTLLVDSDGYHYQLPPFMINDPIFTIFENPAKKLKTLSKIKLKARVASIPNDLEIEIDNNKTGQDLKTIIAEIKGTEIDKIRVFFNGKEIKDTDILVNCNLEDGMVIQVFLSGKMRSLD